MTAEALERELSQLCEAAGPEQAKLIQDYFERTKALALSLKTTPLSQVAGGLGYHGVLGGCPLMPTGFAWPRDRSGAPMFFLAQFDLARMPSEQVGLPQKGLLTIFRASSVLTMSVKDRRSFQIVYLPKFDYAELAPLSPPEGGEVSAPTGAKQGDLCQGELPAFAVMSSPAWTVTEQFDHLESQFSLPPQAIAGLRLWAKKFNALSLGGNSRLFGAELPGLSEQKEICSFASSGITYNQARSQDSHYSHLMEEAPKWMLLACFDEEGLFNDRKSSSASPGTEDQNNKHVAQTRILIRQEDLAPGLFERAWMICLPQSD